MTYLYSTTAPAAWIASLILSASSTLTFSLITLGVPGAQPSTIFLAPIKSKPQASLIALITAIFVGPTSFNTIVTSVGPAGAASSVATATGAAATAAVTPNSSSSALIALEIEG